MEKFTVRYEQLRSDCIKYIIKSLKKNNNNVVFATEEEIESDDFDMWDYPQAIYIGNNDYTYYTIVGITLDKGRIWFNGVCVDGDSYNFGETEVDIACLCDCCNLLTETK